MADVRSMLRQSRESRRVTHPHASYTADSKIRCNLCDTLVKSEAAWQSHLHSSQHTLRQTRAQEAAAIRTSTGAGKKRKAESQNSPPPEDRKKAKSVTFAAGVEESEEDVEEVAGPDEVTDSTKDALKTASSNLEPGNGNEDVVDPVEMAAFERELAEMEASMASTAAERATISAPAMTAEEVAAQAREEYSMQRGNRDVELEAEREDAAKMLEDEFEEMEGLEERVKRLRERREKLRLAERVAADGALTLLETKEIQEDNDAGHESDDEEDDDDDEDVDEWAFGVQ